MCLLYFLLIYFVGVIIIIVISYIENYNRPVYLRESMKSVYIVSMLSWILIFSMIIISVIESDWYNKIKNRGK